jgi:hypothetical protein
MKKDAKDIYKLTLAQLKAQLAKEDCPPSVIKLGLEFAKMYGLDEEVQIHDKDRSVGALLKALPFKKVQ